MVFGRNFKSPSFFCFFSSQKSQQHFFHRLGTPDPMVVDPGRFGPSRVTNSEFSLNPDIEARYSIGLLEFPWDCGQILSAFWLICLKWLIFNNAKRRIIS